MNNDDQNQDDLAVDHAQHVANNAKKVAKKATQPIRNKAKNALMDKTAKLLDKLAQKSPGALKNGFLWLERKVLRLKTHRSIKKRLERRAREAAHRMAMRFIKFLAKLLAKLFKLLLTMLPYIIGGLLIAGLFTAICAWFLNRDLTQRFASYNLQEDNMGAENPYSIDRDGNYVSLAKRMSKGNKMYFIYYAYNAQNSWYVANVKINPKTKKEEAIDWQSDKYVKTILGYSPDHKLEESLERAKGVYGNQLLLKGNEPLYQNVIDKRLGNDAKEAVEAFTMNTNMLYLLDQSLNRPGTGGTNSGFYFSEQFTKPMYTDKLFNYKSLIDRNTGKWNAQSWVMDTKYRAKTESLDVTSSKRNPLHEPDNKLLDKVNVAQIRKKMRALGEVSESVALPGPIQKYKLYEGFKDAKHPYPYENDISTKAFRDPSDTTEVAPKKRTKKEIEELKKEANDPLTKLKDLLGGTWSEYKDEGQKYNEFLQDAKSWKQKRKPKKPSITYFKQKKIKVNRTDIAKQYGCSSWAEFKKKVATPGNSGWSKFWRWVQEKTGAAQASAKQWISDLFHGNDTLVPIWTWWTYTKTSKNNGDLINQEKGSKDNQIPLFTKEGKKEIENAINHPQIEYTDHSSDSQLVAKNDVADIFDRAVSSQMRSNRDLKGWIAAWKKYYIGLQRYKMLSKHNVQKTVAKERKEYKKATERLLDLIGYTGNKSKAANEIISKYKGKMSLLQIFDLLGKSNAFNAIKNLGKNENKFPELQEHKIKLEGPNTHTGANLKYANGVWNYGFGSIVKFAQFPISYAEKIDWDNSGGDMPTGGASDIGGMSVKNAKGAKEAYYVANALSKRLGVPASIIFAQMALETGNFGVDAGNYNLSGMKWVPGNPESEKGRVPTDNTGGNYRNFKSAAEYARAYGNTIKSFIGDKHPHTAAEYAHLLHGTPGHRYYTAGEGDYASGIASKEAMYNAMKKKYKHNKTQAPSAADLENLHQNGSDQSKGQQNNSDNDSVNVGANWHLTDPLTDSDWYSKPTVKLQDAIKQAGGDVPEKNKGEDPGDYLDRLMKNASGLENTTKDKGKVNTLKGAEAYADYAKNPNEWSVTSIGNGNNGAFGTTQKPRDGSGSTLSGVGGKLSGVQYGYYINKGYPAEKTIAIPPHDQVNVIVNGNQSRFRNNSTLNQHKEYFLTGVTTPVGTVDLTKTLYYGRKNLPASYKPFDTLQKGNHGQPNKDWDEDKGKALHKQRVYDTLVQRRLWHPYENGEDNVCGSVHPEERNEFPNSQGAITNPKNATSPKNFRVKYRPTKADLTTGNYANGNAQNNGQNMYNVYSIVIKKGNKTIVIWEIQSATVTLISDAPKINSETWKAITKPMIAQFQDKDHGAANIETSDFSLHGTEYFRQYMMNYSTYTPNSLQNAKNFNLAKEMNMFETGRTFEFDSDKKRRYGNLIEFFDKKVSSGNVKNSSEKDSKQGETQGKSPGNTKLQNVQKYWSSIEKWSKHFGIDPYMLAAQIMQESSGNPNASNANHYGLGQTTPGESYSAYDFVNKKTVHIDVTHTSNPDQQIKFAASHLQNDFNHSGNTSADAAAQTYGTGSTVWHKYFVGPGGLSKIYWYEKKGNKVIKHYNNGKTEKGGTISDSGSGSSSGTGSAINSFANSIMDSVKGYLRNFSDGFKSSKESIMGSVWQSMFHKANFSKSVDIWTYDERNNDPFNAKAKSYKWFSEDSININSDEKLASFDNEGRMSVTQTDLQHKMTEPTNTNISIVNNGAQMYGWIRYRNNLSYDQFKQVMRAWMGIRWSEMGRKTLYDDTPTSETQMSYDLDNDIVNVFGDLYLKDGALSKLDKLKRVIKLAFGDTNPNVVGSGLPTIATGEEDGKKDLNSTSDDANSDSFDKMAGEAPDPKNDKAPGVLNEYNKDRLEAYQTFDNRNDIKDYNKVPNMGTFNGKDVMFQSEQGEGVKAFASGLISHVDHNTVTIVHNGAHVTYRNIIPSVQKGASVKAGQAIGKVSDKGMLRMGLNAPMGHEGSLDVNQTALARIVKELDPVQAKEETKQASGSSSVSKVTQAPTVKSNSDSDDLSERLQEGNGAGMASSDSDDNSNSSSSSFSDSNEFGSGLSKDTSSHENSVESSIASQSNSININNEHDAQQAYKNQVVQYDNTAPGQAIDPTLLYTPEEDDNGDAPGNANASALVKDAEHFLGKFHYSASRTADSHWKHPGANDTTDCSGFVWLELKRNGFKVPSTFWYTQEMENDARGPQHYLKRISRENARPGDIVIMNIGDGTGPNGHTAILTTKWKGFHGTKIIQSGNGDHINRGDIYTSFYSLLGGRITFARPIPAKK